GELFAGVIQEVDQRKDENGDGYFEQLLAVPAWTLLSQPKFVQALRPGDLAARVKKEEDWKGRAIKKIAAELGRITDNVAVEQFQDRFGSDIRNTDARGELALRLFDRPDLFSRLSAIRRECQRERLDGATRRLIEIEHQLFPRIFPQEWRQAQWQLLQTGKTRLMWRAAASASGAEAARAGMDARPLRFRSDQNNAPESWRGTAALELGPLVLDAPTPEATALRILERLACDELPPDLLPVTATILAKTKSDRCNVQPGDLKLTADAAPTLAKKLWAYVSEQAQMDEATPYCLIRVDDGHLTRERFEAAYVHLQRWLPELDFMELHPSAESGEYEVKLLSLLKSRVEG
ncbi:MAG TPA: hypothetical protein PLV92_23935, partial [Pirellulaceae bacterium]|nr:hypothetical protein [Pirellulaceae bacterium]